MTLATQPLRDEHKDLYPHLESLKIAGISVHVSLTQSSLDLIDEAYRFLSFHLLPHAFAEEAALYPMVQKVMGSPLATATMSRDHKEVEKLTMELGELRSKLSVGEIGVNSANELKQLLFGLYVLVKVHFAKEEEVYLPLLDAKLTVIEAQAMYSSMEKAAHQAMNQVNNNN
ncbi:MAG TPA: hemerythrin domain-containing protein [Anaerolineales bacterium]|nr:hemerythrin domain-containing protein [Anaerolineales bacterium]